MTRTTAGRSSRNMMSSSREMQGRNNEVDGLDAEKRNQDAADAVDQQIATQQWARPDGPVRDALQRQRNQSNDDQGVEDDRRQDGALRRLQMHDVQCLQLRVKGKKN